MACLSQSILCILTVHCSFQSLIITLSYFMDASPVCGADINMQLLCTDYQLSRLSKSTEHIRHSRAQEIGERKLVFQRELLNCRLWWSHFVHWFQKRAKQVCHSLHSKETSIVTWKSKFGTKGSHQDDIHFTLFINIELSTLPCPCDCPHIYCHHWCHHDLFTYSLHPREVCAWGPFMHAVSIHEMLSSQTTQKLRVKRFLVSRNFLYSKLVFNSVINQKEIRNYYKCPKN